VLAVSSHWQVRMDGCRRNHDGACVQGLARAPYVTCNRASFAMLAVPILSGSCWSRGLSRDTSGGGGDALARTSDTLGLLLLLAYNRQAMRALAVQLVQVPMLVVKLSERMHLVYSLAGCHCQCARAACRGIGVFCSGPEQNFWTRRN
jgi:hypothetical protein